MRQDCPGVLWVPVVSDYILRTLSTHQGCPHPEWDGMEEHAQLINYFC